MEVGRGARGVSGRADVAEYGAWGDVCADCGGRRIGVEVRVVVGAPARAEDIDGVAAERIFSHTHDITGGGREDGRAAPGENVLTFVAAVARTRRVPRTLDLRGAHAFNGYDQRRVGRLRVERGGFERQRGGR